MNNLFIKFLLLTIFFYCLQTSLSAQNAVLTQPTCSTCNDGSITVNWSGSGVKRVVLNGVIQPDNQLVFTGLGVGLYSLLYQTPKGNSGNWKDEGSESITLSASGIISYCTSNGDTNYNTSITLVNLNTLNNDTSGDIPKSAGYNDFTSQSTDMMLGAVYDLTVNLNTDGNYEVFAIVWIDWNQDGDFDDTGESISLGSVQNVANGPTIGSPFNIAVPTGAILGNTRMRVSAKWNSYPTSCETDFDGEVEDYTINVVANSLPTIISFTPDNACSNSNQVVTITGTNFLGTTSVQFNGVAAASYTINSATQINATLPTSTTSGTITVTAPDGTATSTQPFTVNSLPEAAGNITGTSIVLPGDTKSYVCASIGDATSYEWEITGGGASITNNGTQADIAFASNASPGDRTLTVKGVNACGEGSVSATFTIYVRPSYACQTTIINWDFDSPDLAGADWRGYSTVNGWQSSRNNIEIWRNGFLGFTTVDGGQFCELNSTGVNEMWQNMNTVPGSKMRWEITYRYRSNSSESIRIKIGAVGSLSSIADISNNNGDGWVTHSGFYTVPAGQTTTQFRIATLAPSSSSGNLIDNIQFYSIEPDIEDPTFDCPPDLDGDGFVVSECVDATSLIVNNIGVTNVADNCTPVADLLVEYKITNKPTPTSAETLLVNYGDDPAGAATSSDASAYAFPLGESTVTYKITDASGHETTCSFKIQISAKPKPVGIFYE
ncbi:HYR domain-containing protein [Ancylomarina euxinus]|uniref:HYR domain-containing protein n=1 Tax=Ancylomarina euxinus TaxID=2283627 RepID=A0A425Y4X0_9BACT|nr:GEVED domain-containing protein [Ancylomarina euxinus]MCZ4694444.1 GEVED domain-containing protein [Ancylomarina euxinus]MUP16657.1 HYR domain-containing protein [Ancylomarina euxinus]RRG23548.1 HYR domain-containing protein [Ancylomarina euxinus]